MQPLDKTLRNQLEKTVKEAREIAESAARASLEQLGVAEANPYSHLSDADKELRRRLRAHGHQLGNGRNAKGEQELDRLVDEVAYEHWHRMLFARFLAENNLLMYPDPDDPVAVTLEECEDLASDEGAQNGWELAARFASKMLPQIFRHDSPVFQFVLPPEHQQKLEQLLADLPQEVFTASDSLGWVYQFWQAKRKDEVNASEVKIGARELPAVTQLFTEPYMVSFLLDNSLGAWWAARRLSEDDLRNAKSEQELREKASLPGVPLEYLRFVRVPSPLGGEGKGEGEVWTPAAGTFDGWPEHLSELKTLDPCCGSGHFLVAAFLMLVPMRMELEGLSAQDAVDAVLKENIHGLEIDQRCVELAAFALALTSWRYPEAGGYRPLPVLNVACSGLSISVAKEEWKQLALDKKNLRIALEWMYEEFKDAPVLGSLLNPAKSKAAKIVEWETLAPMLEEALSQEQSDEEHEAAVVAHGLAKAATLLANKYKWVITNVPYLARGKQSDTLRDFCERHYPEGKNDIATVFLDRCLEFCTKDGTSTIVLPQNWLFLTSYKKFREKLLQNDVWHMIARLGPGAFETISGEVVKAILICLSQGNTLTPTLSQRERGQQSLLPLGEGARRADEGIIRGVDVSKPRTAAEKASGLLKTEIKSVEQAKQLENPDARVVFANSSHESFLADYCTCIEGISTGDIPRFVMFFWEIRSKIKDWVPFIQNVTNTTFYSGRSDYILWENGTGSLHSNPTAHNFPSENMNGYRVLGNKGIRITQMGKLPVTLYEGEVFGKNGGTLVLKDNAHLPAVYSFCESDEYSELVREIDQSMAVTVGSMIKVPFELDLWTKVAQEKYPNGLPKPFSDDPTQWIFHGHPARSDEPLQVAVARLLGYRWPAELDKEMELSDEAREWVKKSESLLSYADDDGIVCIPAVRGEVSGVDRLLNLLAAAYGDEWSNDILSELLNNANHAGKTLETWLREKFFTQHCKLFQHRPFIWHIWDGLRDGFAALVNYHKLDRKNLETLIYTYVGDWISRQKQDINNGIDGAEEKLAAAETLKKRLELILEGEAPYDIFVRWKPIEKQPIGWDPDLNDGVRLNIRPFMTVPDVGKKGAGLLRDKPNIKWTKDRGKDVESAPWYHLFKGDRINDHHLSLEEKEAAKG